MLQRKPGDVYKILYSKWTGSRCRRIATPDRSEEEEFDEYIEMMEWATQVTPEEFV